MGLKKSLIFVGSVFVLAACDRAGAPTGPMSLHEGAASSKVKPAPTTELGGSTTSSLGCWFVRQGEMDSTFTTNCEQPQEQ